MLTFPKAEKLKSLNKNLPVLIEEKLDGSRLFLSQDFACSRRLNQYGVFENMWDRLPEHLQKLARRDVGYEGELVWPGHEASDVTTALKEKSPELRFVGYNYHFPEGAKNWVQALAYPRDITEFLNNRGIETPILWDLAYVDFSPELEERLRERAEARGFEGWIVKSRAKYPLWHKLKLDWTYDLVVMGFKISEGGKWRDLVGAIELGAYIDGVLKPVCFCSGMNDEIRLGLSDMDLGRIVEVKCNGVAAQGRLRHPRFIRWRDDKNTTECTLEQFDASSGEKIRRRAQASDA